MDGHTFLLRNFRKLLVPVLLASSILIPGAGWPEALPVRHIEGGVHGFLVMQTLDGKTVADGELLQQTDGDRVTLRLVFRFHDGSSYEDTAVFTQRGNFKLLSDHLKQQGPSFKTPLESNIDTSTGQVQVRYKDGHGRDQMLSQKMDMPSDVSNGLLPILVKNVPQGLLQTVSYIAITPKPRVVRIAISSQGQDQVSIGNSSRKVTKFDLKFVIGGLTGVVARIAGKQPPDTYMWILPGEVPALLRMQGPLYDSGPIWQINLAAPTWPK